MNVGPGMGMEMRKETEMGTGGELGTDMWMGMGDGAGMSTEMEPVIATTPKTTDTKEFKQ